MIESEWKSVLLDYDRSATEFTGDDVDQFSALCDLGKAYDSVTIFVPTIDSSTIGIWVQRVASTATVPVAWHHGQVTGETPAFGTAAFATTASTGSYVINIPLPGIQYLRIRCNSNQTADRTFLVRGIRS
jgi:hypothetical protein